MIKKETALAKAINVLSTSLQDDPEYRYGWQSTIAQACLDAIYWKKKKLQKRALNQKELHAACNEGADQFLKSLTSTIEAPTQNAFIHVYFDNDDNIDSVELLGENKDHIHLIYSEQIWQDISYCLQSSTTKHQIICLSDKIYDILARNKLCELSSTATITTIEKMFSDRYTFKEAKIYHNDFLKELSKLQSDCSCHKLNYIMKKIAALTDKPCVNLD
ncbi:MAG: hypothetical protein GY804_08880 [Alphaproteobacteria bacterium]|nr:hypothetical protein [Alphaproteobacteria bacterium]